MLDRLGVGLEGAHLLGWDAVGRFVANLGMDSATFRALHPEEAAFASPLQQSYMLAEIIDTLRRLEHAYTVTHLKKGYAEPPPPEPFPRPGVKPRTQHIGSDPIPIADFDNWYYGGD